MIRKRLGRFATVLTAASMLMLLLGVAPAAAATPGWQFQNVQQLPASVGVGKVAGFSFRIYNGGKSNISALYLTDTAVGSPEFVSNSRGTVCETVPELKCAFGALNAKAFIDVTVAYRVGSSNFSLKFQLDSTGDPAGGNNSHGDSAFTQLLTTTVGNSNGNFDGGFTLGSATFATTGNLGSGNKQTTSLDVTDLHIPVTVTDGISSFPCTSCTSHQIGEWSVVDVNSGNSGPIKVTIMVWGGSVPGGVSASSLYLIHADGSGGFNIVNQQCDATHSNADCLAGVPVKVGNNYKIVAWLTHNGGLRGGF